MGQSMNGIVTRLMTPKRALAVATALLTASAVARMVMAAPVQAADLNVPTTDGENARIAFLSAWLFNGLGTPNHQSYFLILQSVVGATFANAASAQLLIYLVPLAIAPFAAFRLFRLFALSETISAGFAIVYLLSPWLAYNFLSGEPLFVWVFAILPLVLAEYIAASQVVWNGLRGVLVLSALFIIGEAFTLQSIVVFALFSLPSIAAIALDAQWRRLGHLVFAVVIAVGAAVATSVAGLSAYSTAVQTELQLSRQSLFAGFSGQDETAFALGIILFTGFLIFEVLLLSRASKLPSADRNYALGFVLLATCTSALFFAIPSDVAYWVFTHVPAISPFLDPDKFLLISWLSVVICTLILVKDYMAVFSQIRNFLRISTPRFGRGWFADPKSSPRAARRSSRVSKINLPQLALAASLGCAIVLISTVAGPYPANVSNFVAGQGPVTSNRVPTGYFAVGTYLLDHGASFGFGPRTVVMPTNPGQIIPFYVASTSIPGYLQPSVIMENITDAVAGNDSGVAKLLSLLGVEYIVVPPTPANPWWPTGANGPPTPVGVAPNEYVAQGNPADYVKIFQSWSLFAEVYASGGFWVFENRAYNGPVYAYENKSLVQNISVGDFQTSLNLTPTGRDLVVNGNLSSGSLTPLTTMNVTSYSNLSFSGSNQIENDNLSLGTDWTVSTEGNSSLLPNGTFLLSPGSYGISASQQLALPQGSCYGLAYSLKTHPGYAGYPPSADQRTYIGLYSDSGAVVLPQTVGNVSGSFYYGLKIPRESSSENVSLILHAEPPLGDSAIYTTFGNLSLRMTSCMSIPFPFESYNWTSAFGSGQVLTNGTISVPYGSHGFSTEQEIQLAPNTTYVISFHVVSNQSLSTPLPSSDLPTYVAVYWPGGAAVFNDFTGPTNTTFSSTFRVSGLGEKVVNATLVLTAAPPLFPGILFTSFSDVNLHSIDGRDMFGKEVIASAWVQTGATDFRLLPVLESGPSFMTLSVGYSGAWLAETASGQSLTVTSGPDGLLTIEIPRNVSTVLLWYAEQSLYTAELSVGLSVMTVTCSGALYFAIAARSSRFRLPHIERLG